VGYWPKVTEKLLQMGQSSKLGEGPFANLNNAGDKRCLSEPTKIFMSISMSWKRRVYSFG
jgi:hypothetical protein